MENVREVGAVLLAVVPSIVLNIYLLSLLNEREATLRLWYRIMFDAACGRARLEAKDGSIFARKVS